MPRQGTMSDYLANMLLNASMNDGGFTLPTNVYIALATSQPALDANASTLAEPGGTWTNYARVQIPAASMGPAATRKKTNTSPIDFGTAVTGGNVNITHWAIVDSASGAGNVLWVGDFESTIVVQNGNPVSIPAGDLDLEILTTEGVPT